MSLSRSLFAAALAVGLIPQAFAQNDGGVLAGEAAFGDWRGDEPGVRRLIRPQDLPAPGPTSSGGARVIGRADEALLKVPDGFEVSLFANGLGSPRTIRPAGNGDVFVAESSGNRIRVFRTEDGSNQPSTSSIFAEGLDQPYGIAFYPPGNDPEYVYIGQSGSVVRYPYRIGDMEARGPAEIVVDNLPVGGHWTRDIAFSPDGERMFLAVGSLSNVAQDMSRPSPAQIEAFQARHGLGAAWGAETNRAKVLAFDADGGNATIFATGIRNCSGLAVQPETGALWCATNERDGIGDDLPPDYVTRVEEGRFYGWPWFYIGDNEDPRHAGARPDLAGEVTVPDVLIQAHSAPLGITFYDGKLFPEAYRGDGFVALHGSWNRGNRTGYKIVRILVEDGVPTGVYEDFMTGFVIDSDSVWGRPVGVAVAKDGALLVSEDGNDTIWRVAPRAR